MIAFVQDDGGRSASGFKGHAGDCVTRAIAIATEQPYREVYDALFERQREFMATSRSRKAQRGTATPRTGVWRDVYEPYLIERGWLWTPTMQIGSGCTVHLRADELPSGRLVVRLSRHVAAVLDGVLHDTYDCSRDGARCVYGYFAREEGA